MKILYVNAMTDEVGGETYAAGLQRAVERSALAKSGTAVEFVRYNLFYGDKQPARLMGYFARQHQVSAVVLSGSAKNTTDHGDPFLDDYYAGLKDLLGYRSGFDEWQGPEWPVFGICFGHQALACALGGETARFALTVGPRDVRLLPRAHYHTLLKPMIKVDPRPTRRLVMFHGDHVVRMPTGFHALMTSDYCDIQAMAHDQWPIISVQAHPEGTRALKDDPEDLKYWEGFTDAELDAEDGWNLLARFIDWADRAR